ncbi:MAG: Dabb family protein, partial [Bacteroidales bacterium]|nr:Dabb family protein [Bacteroidales bacterium]
KFIRKLGGITAMLALGSTARAKNMNRSEEGEGNDKELEGGFFHMVFFWLVDDTPEVKEKFLKELNNFVKEVDEIKKVHIGPPADTDRDVIDNTYSYNLLITFDSKKQQDIYQEHPAHKKFIENASSLWKKVLVYDSIKK